LTSARVDPLCGFAAVVGFARVIEGQQEGRCLMFAVIVLSSIVAVIGFGLRASVVAGAGAGL